jgi:hypothetical protein
MPNGLTVIACFLFMAAIGGLITALSDPTLSWFYFAYGGLSALALVGTVCRFKAAWYLLILIFGALITIYANTLLVALFQLAELSGARGPLIAKKSAQIVLLSVALRHMLTDGPRKYFGIPSAMSPAQLSGSESGELVERMMATRVASSITWLLLVAVISQVIIGVIAGASISDWSLTDEEFMQASEAYVEVIRRKYGVAILVGPTSIWLLLSLLGKLPGTTRIKRVR